MTVYRHFSDVVPYFGVKIRTIYWHFSYFLTFSLSTFCWHIEQHLIDIVTKFNYNLTMFQWNFNNSLAILQLYAIKHFHRIRTYTMLIRCFPTFYRHSDGFVMILQLFLTNFVFIISVKSNYKIRICNYRIPNFVAFC